VIVPTDRLPDLAGRVTMVDGGFDPIHAGHIAYFRAAAELGDPVLCNISSDEWVGRKHRPLLPQPERAQVVDAIRHIDYVHLSSMPTVAVLDLLRPIRYAKGVDWRDRLPKEEVELCERLGVVVVFLDTVFNSSTDIIRRYTCGDTQGGAFPRD
jgi:cytidyltransferase-like protein